MKIKIFCEKCNKYDIIERIPDNQEEATTNKSMFALPVPKSGDSGLTSLSIVHADHILIADVDKNGDVRKYKIIDRVGQELELILAKIANTIIQTVITTRIDPISFVFLTHSRNIEKVLLGIFQQILFNLPNNENILGTLSVSNNMALFELDNLTVYVGKWHDRIFNIAGSKSVVIHHLTINNTQEVYNNINNIEKLKLNSQNIMLFNENVIKNDQGKKIIGDIMMKISPEAVLDVSNTLNIGNNIARIVEMYLPKMTVLSQFS